MLKKRTPIISLHLGVHKTATTYIQTKLRENIPILRNSGINYIPLGELRKKLTKNLHSDKFDENDIYDFLYPYLNCDRLIISDENILGGVDRPRRGFLYPSVRKKIDKIIKSLDGCDIEIYITIRNFPDYILSRYSESLRHFRFQVFEDYISELDDSTISWVPFLDDIASTGLSKIYVNDFKYVVDGGGYFNKLIGKNIKLDEPEETSSTRRSKISLEAYNIAKLYSETYSENSTPKLVNLLDSYPQKKKINPFSPFEKSRIRQLTERYKEDIEYVKSDSRFIYLCS